MTTKRISLIIAVLVVLSMALVGTGMAQEDPQTAADAYFSGGTQNIKAADLFENLSDGDTSNDPVILDLRAPDDYALGHIPGAINVGVKALFTADKMAELELDADTPVVTYCYTGQTSSQATSALNMLGYDAQSMLYGFPTWANIEGVSVAPFNPEVDRHDYIDSDEVVEATGAYDLGTPLADTVAGSSEAYFVNGTKNIKASALFENLSDGDTSNDPYLIDVRAPEDYAAGHIPGAVNMSAKTIFTPESLATIPADQPVVVNCYSGQTASQVTSALNQLGYDATNLKFGYASWSPEGKYSFVSSTSPNYNFEGEGTVVEVDDTMMADDAGAMAVMPVATEAPVGAYTWSMLSYDLGVVSQVTAAAADEDGTIIRITLTSPTADTVALEEALVPVMEAFGAK